MKKLVISTFMVCFITFFAFGQHHSNKAYLGVYSSIISQKKASKLNFEKPYGAYLTSIVPNSPAEKNNFQPFDYIYQIGEFEFSAHNDLGDILANFSPNETATIYFLRKGVKQTKEIQFGIPVNGNNNHRNRTEDPFLGVSQNHSKIPSSVVGVSVNIIENSTAKKMGLENNDIINEINDYPIYDWHDMRTAIDMLKICDPIKVKYIRGEKTETGSYTIQSVAATYDNYQDNCPEEKKVSQPEVIAQSSFTPTPPELFIKIKPMPLEDSKKMEEELEIKMPVVNNLSIEQLKIFPNPSQGVFNLQFNLPNNDITQIRIFDGSGKMVYSNDLGSFSGDFNDRLDLTNNPAGTYYLMVQQGAFSISKKVIIARP